MKFNIPKATRFLPLQEYDPEIKELAGIGIHVWVDPPRSILEEYDELNRSYAKTLNQYSAWPDGKPNPKNILESRISRWLKLAWKKDPQRGFTQATKSYQRSMLGWWVRMWSQNPDPATHWTVEELGKISDENPRLLDWLCSSSWALIEKHRDDVKKGYRGPSEKSPATERPATPSSLVSS